MAQFKQITDSELEKSIRDRISWDIRISNSDLVFHIRNGVVNLFGNFDEAFRHAAAIDVISSTQDVVRVIDHSKISSNYYRSDEELENLILRQINNFHLLNGEFIHVRVADGVAQVEGTVYRPHLKAFAAKASWALSGIKDCLNLIRVVSPPRQVNRISVSTTIRERTIHLAV